MSEGRKTPSAAPGTWGGQEPSRFLAARGGVVTAPGLGSTYCVPLANGSQRVFSAGWYLQEGLVSPSPLCLQQAFGLGNCKCMTPRYCPEGTAPPEGRLGLLSYPTRALALGSSSAHTA